MQVRAARTQVRFSDFEASMEGENNERALEPVGEIRLWRFELPGRNENRARDSEEDQEPRTPLSPQSRKRRMVSALPL